jgi:CBS domain-containing protein
MGGATAILLNSAMPGLNLAPGAFALAAMAAVFGAASRSTFAFIIFAFEITQDYNAILPLMLVCVIADAVALVFMRNTVMTEKLARRGLRVPQEYEADPMQQVTVGQMMVNTTLHLKGEMRVKELADRIARGEPDYVRHQAFLIVDEEDHLAGVITRGDLLAALDEPAGEDLSVLQAGSSPPVIAYPDEMLHDALNKLLRNDIGRLPVVSREDPRKIVGYLSRGGILRARRHRIEEEHTREAGWLGRLRPGGF